MGKSEKICQKIVKIISFFNRALGIQFQMFQRIFCENFVYFPLLVLWHCPKNISIFEFRANSCLKIYPLELIYAMLVRNYGQWHTLRPLKNIGMNENKIKKTVIRKEIVTFTDCCFTYTTIAIIWVVIGIRDKWNESQILEKIKCVKVVFFSENKSHER